MLALLASTKLADGVGMDVMVGGRVFVGGNVRVAVLFFVGDACDVVVTSDILGPVGVSVRGLTVLGVSAQAICTMKRTTVTAKHAIFR
jgi:hypothetical protein